MSLHSNFSVTDPSAIYMGPAPIKKEASTQSTKPVEITWNDDVSEESNKKSVEKSKGFSFFDFLDIINPLQHIPIVSSIYRHFTGDEIGGPARVAGGALFGGPIGAAVSGVDVIIAQQNGGEYVGDRVFANLMDGNKSKAVPVPEPVQVAIAEPIIEVDPFDDEFLFEDFTTEAEDLDRQRKLALARDNYIKSLNLAPAAGSQISQLY